MSLAVPPGRRDRAPTQSPPWRHVPGSAATADSPSPRRSLVASLEEAWSLSEGTALHGTDVGSFVAGALAQAIAEHAASDADGGPWASRPLAQLLLQALVALCCDPFLPR